MPSRTLRIDLPIDDDADPRLLRGALLAARGSELAELHRRGFRHYYGKDSDSKRETLSDEVRQHQQRLDLLDRLIAALETATEAR